MVSSFLFAVLVWGAVALVLGVFLYEIYVFVYGGTSPLNAI
jgi:hypothetical protein